MIMYVFMYVYPEISPSTLFYELFSLSEEQALFDMRSPMGSTCKQNGGYVGS